MRSAASPSCETQRASENAPAGNSASTIVSTSGSARPSIASSSVRSGVCVAMRCARSLRSFHSASLAFVAGPCMPGTPVSRPAHAGAFLAHASTPTAIQPATSDGKRVSRSGLPSDRPCQNAQSFLQRSTHSPQCGMRSPRIAPSSARSEASTSR